MEKKLIARICVCIEALPLHILKRGNNNNNKNSQPTEKVEARRNKLSSQTIHTKTHSSSNNKTYKVKYDFSFTFVSSDDRALKTLPDTFYSVYMSVRSLTILCYFCPFGWLVKIIFRLRKVYSVLLCVF